MKLGLSLLLGVLMGCESVQPLPPSKPTPPTYRTEIIARSVENRPIERVVFLGDPRRPALIIAAIHGNEQASADVAGGLIQLLKAEPQLTHRRAITIIPIANPDGYAQSSRLNANRIDLNRNFPAKNFKPGPHAKTPLGEPESAALAAQIQQIHPTLLISIHAIDGKRQCNNYDGPAREIAEAMSQKNGYPATSDIGYPVPGSLGSWAGKELQIPMITLELPQGISGAEAWKTNRAALLAALNSR